MSRPVITIADLAAHTDQEVTIRGWVYNWRKKGKLRFIILRDGFGYLQCVVFRPEVDEALSKVVRRAIARDPRARFGSVVELARALAACEEIERVELFIDTGVRVELYNASAALASVTLTRRAADAARNNLVLVVDLYRRGKVDIITLIDAQTQSLVADLAAAGIACLSLTGQTKERAGVLDAFAHGEAPVFLLSLKAGGVGLTLPCPRPPDRVDRAGRRRQRCDQRHHQ